MKPIVAGSREDVAGFALAGIDGVVCTSREEAGKVLAEAKDDTLVFLSSAFASARTVRTDGSFVVVLPPES
jgi:vacuolar-type H+-ATPase subunit F/Vma7